MSVFLLNVYVSMYCPHTYQKAYKPPEMKAVQNYTSLASHAGGSVYALQDGKIAEFTLQTSDYGQWNLQGRSVTP